jgi:hypothetical protein
MKNILKLSSIFILSLFVMYCGRPTINTAAGSWQYLGDKWVNFGLDHDELVLGNIRDNFRQIRLRVTDGPLHIMDMKVHFDNGAVQDVPIKALIKQGQQSRIIDLNGGSRSLEKITFWYETVGFRKGRSRVAVWGLK